MQQTHGPWSPSVSVLVAEADQMNCQLVESVFRGKRKRISIAGVTTDSAEALCLFREHKPDVGLISARLQAGALEGFVLLRDIRSLKLKTRVVVLLDSREKELVIDAFRFGAQGVIFRDEPLATLAKCIHAVHNGQIWANSVNLGYVVEALGQHMPLTPRNYGAMNLLTKREGDIVRLIGEGMPNRDVAAKLNLSEHTVRNYLLRVFDKLGVSSRVELVLYCFHSDPEEMAASRD